jgi:AraC family transcriptional regulator, ethanolamine operon transcriptional activator
MAIIRSSSTLLTDISQFNALTRRGTRTYTQLDRGQFESRLSSIEIEAAVLISCSLNRAVVGSISSRPDTVYIGYSRGGENGTSFNGAYLDQASVILHWGDEPKFWKTRAGFHIGAVELPLHAIVDDDLSARMRAMRNGSALLMGRPDLKGELLRYVKAAEAIARQRQAAAPSERFADAFVAHCRSVIRRGIEGREPNDGHLPLTRSLKLFAGARALIDDTDGAILNVPQLAAALGVSERTLLLGFRAAIGRTPQEFLRLYRLNRAREQLLRRSEGARARNAITEAAMSWGFWHLGRFSAYYRDMFGEYPLETVSGRRMPERRHTHEECLVA